LRGGGRRGGTGDDEGGAAFWCARSAAISAWRGRTTALIDSVMSDRKVFMSKGACGGP
jgi:hypothetical protein